MTLETYLKNREVFESRYVPSGDFGQCYINEMNKGIRNFKLFFAIWGHDRNIILNSNTFGVDKRKRYTIPFKNSVGTKIVIRDFDYSMIDKYREQFEKLRDQILMYWDKITG